MFKKTFVVILYCFCFNALAQNNSSSQESLVDIDVLAVYEDVVHKGYNSAQIYRTLAKGRFLENNYNEAKKWFELLWESDSEPKANDFLLFSQTLTALDQKEQAQVYLTKYQQLIAAKKD